MEARKRFWLLTLIVLYIASAETLADLAGRVVAVTDGDTIKVLDRDKVQHKIRLSGIDAPERKQAYGNASRKHLASLVASKQVTVESNKTGKYSRIAGKVWINGTDANLEQVKAGYAWWYNYYRKEQSEADRKAYSNAEKEAREAKRGLWADPNPINPYEWRKIN